MIMVHTKIRPLPMGQVTVTDEYCANAFNKEIAYLLSFDTDRLLAGFRETAGLDMRGAVRYSGWEDDLIGGHCVGHYMTAVAQAYASLQEGDSRRDALYKLAVTMTDGLKECQQALGTGFIFGAKIIDKNNVEAQFDNVEKNLSNIMTQAWVPYYTLHKILAGAIDIYRLTGYENAKTVASRLGDWVYRRVSRWSEETQRTVLGIEYGGMNDCLYELYAVTGKEEHAIAAHCFDEVPLFEIVYAGTENALNNKHANTTIPKFLGALKRYAILDGRTVDGETVDAGRYLGYAERFWDMVVQKHSYITGGNSEWEHFGCDYVLDAERTNANCETCNTYNMLKLSRLLFEITGEKKYADYYENTFINAILSSQNPETGMSTYFQPMASGYFKVYSTPYTKFWCCTGSGMENFTKLGDSIYFTEGNALIVNQYISSSADWSDKGVKIEQMTDIPNSDTAKFMIHGKGGISLKLRLPDWLAGDAVITVDGKAYDADINGGYAEVSGIADGSVVEIKLPMEVRAHSLPDNKNTYGFRYGPIVLSARLGTAEMTDTMTGIEVTIPQYSRIETTYVPSGSEKIHIADGTVSEFIENITENLVRVGNRLEFALKHTDAELTFLPHYSQYKQRYGIYWQFLEKGAQQDAGGSQPKDLLDTVQTGYGQYENDELHQMAEYGNGSTGVTDSGTSRCANAGGSFSYRMLVDDSAETSLLAAFAKADSGRGIVIKAGGCEIYSKVLDYDGDDEEYQVEIPIPADIVNRYAENVSANGISGKALTFEFSGIEGGASARLCTFLYTVRKG